MSTYVDPTPVLFRNIRALRKMRGWSAARLSDAFTEAGHPVSRSAIANMESGRAATATVAFLFAAAEVFGTSAGDLAASLCDTCQGSPPDGFICGTCGSKGTL